MEWLWMTVFWLPRCFLPGVLVSHGFCQVPEPAAKSASKKPSAEPSKKACSQGWLVHFDFIEGSFIRAVMLNLSVLIRSHMFWFYSDSSWHFNGTTLNDYEWLFFGSPDVFCQWFLASRGFRQVKSQQPKARPRSHLPRPAKRLALRVGWYTLIL